MTPYIAEIVTSIIAMIANLLSSGQDPVFVMAGAGVSMIGLGGALTVWTVTVTATVTVVVYETVTISKRVFLFFSTSETRKVPKEIQQEEKRTERPLENLGKFVIVAGVSIVLVGFTTGLTTGLTSILTAIEPYSSYTSSSPVELPASSSLQEYNSPESNFPDSGGVSESDKKLGVRNEKDSSPPQSPEILPPQHSF